ncbi:hypothetical protein ES702_01109 [subsurface metagenome]
MTKLASIPSKSYESALLRLIVYEVSRHFIINANVAERQINIGWLPQAFILSAVVAVSTHLYFLPAPLTSCLLPMAKVPPFLFSLCYNLSGKLDTSSAQLQKLSKEVNPPYFEPSSPKEPRTERTRITGLFNYPNLYQPKKSWCLKFFFRSSDLLEGSVRIS